MVQVLVLVVVLLVSFRFADKLTKLMWLNYSGYPKEGGIDGEQASTACKTLGIFVVNSGVLRVYRP